MDSTHLFLGLIESLALSPGHTLLLPCATPASGLVPRPNEEPGNEAIPHLVLIAYKPHVIVLITFPTQLIQQRQLTVEKMVAKEVLTRWIPHNSSVIIA